MRRACFDRADIGVAHSLALNIHPPPGVLIMKINIEVFFRDRRTWIHDKIYAALHEQGCLYFKLRSGQSVPSETFALVP